MKKFFDGVSYVIQIQIVRAKLLSMHLMIGFNGFYTNLFNDLFCGHSLLITGSNKTCSNLIFI